MKVIVDELPKSCAECPCCNWDGDWGFDCNIADVDIQTNYDKVTSQYDCDRQRHKDCPLQSLSDYTKQVRKEVCESIKEQFEKKAHLSLGRAGWEYQINADEFDEFLDLIQGEEK